MNGTWKTIGIVVLILAGVYVLAELLHRRSYAHGHAAGAAGDTPAPPAMPTVIVTAPPPSSTGDGSYSITTGPNAGWSYNGTTHYWTKPDGTQVTYGPPV